MKFVWVLEAISLVFESFGGISLKYFKGILPPLTGQFGSDFCKGGVREKTDRDYFGAILVCFWLPGLPSPPRLPERRNLIEEKPYPN